MSSRTRYFAGHLLPLLGVAGAIVALDHAGMDPWVSGWYYDTQAGAFPWRYNGFLEVVMHHWTKYLVILLAVAAFAGYVISFLSPQLRTVRPLFLFIALALTLAPLTVATLKVFSLRHCPWDIIDFGGFVPYVRWFDAYPPGVAHGRCFPAGHASTGFCLLALYFLGRALGSPSLARAGFLLGLAAGLGLGWVRIMQGAHFASHVLWSGVICWIVIVVLYGILIEQREATGSNYPHRAY